MGGAGRKREFSYQKGGKEGTSERRGTGRRELLRGGNFRKRKEGGG